MKSLLVIPLIIAVCVGGAALLLRAVGVHFHEIDPVLAGAAVAMACIIAILPVALSPTADAASIVQRALIATVLHLLCTSVAAVALIGLHMTTLSGSFFFWLLGAYWLSLMILVWQLRQAILNMTGALKAEGAKLT